jgi:hypothetical protein
VECNIIFPKRRLKERREWKRNGKREGSDTVKVKMILMTKRKKYDTSQDNNEPNTTNAIFAAHLTRGRKLLLRNASLNG